ncbi:hypothetical protein [Kiloniella litopenaei]|uniref:hypothetical protein n=1 Tax=Kiloniella litopenaei TaxID=1549748 RepID=UPI003BAB7D92
MTEEEIETFDRAKEAEKLLSNPLLQEALKLIEERYTLGLKSTCPSRPDELQHWARCLKCGELFEAHLKAVLQKRRDRREGLKVQRRKEKLVLLTGRF